MFVEHRSSMATTPLLFDIPLSDCPRIIEVATADRLRR